MTTTTLMPIRGIDNLSEDAALHQGGKEPFTFVRDAVNVNVLPSGGIEMAASGGKVTDLPYQYLWQSPLHKDVFGVLGDSWVRVNPATWDYDVLAVIGSDTVYHTVLNNIVVAAGKFGIFTYDGKIAQSLTIPTPPPPKLKINTKKAKGDSKGKEKPQNPFKLQRSAAISWVRNGLESALSDIVSETGDGDATVSLPSQPSDVTETKIYLTSFNGTELRLVDTTKQSVAFANDSKLGMAPPFPHQSPMPTGKYLCHWRGRLITATANVIRFSEPLAYHIHDERYGFIQTSQRITFIQPVNNGLWVGQVDHVIFLQGTNPDDMTVITKSSGAPIPDSAIQIGSGEIGEVSNGGDLVTIWLADNGYVAGNSEGQLIEYQASRLGNISAHSGTTVRLARRLLTAVQ